MSTTKKSSLGRGLGALLQGIDVDAPVATAEQTTETATANNTEKTRAASAKPIAQTPVTRSTSAPATDEEGVHDIPVEDINRGTYQPRQHFDHEALQELADCLLYTSPSPRDKRQSRMPSSA